METGSWILPGHNNIKLEINVKNNYKKHTNSQRLDRAPLNNEFQKKKIEGNNKLLELKGSPNTTYANL